MTPAGSGPTGHFVRLGPIQSGERPHDPAPARPTPFAHVDGIEAEAEFIVTGLSPDEENLNRIMDHR